MQEDEDIDTDDLERRMEAAIAVMRRELGTLRTGRASASMLDAVQVEAYDTRMPVNELATINVPEPRMITLNVWDRSIVGAVEKALQASRLGVNPVVEGTLIRLPIPELSAERRQELAKMAGQYAEQARISVRNVRRDGMERLKRQKEGMSEDEMRMWQEEIQQITDRQIRKIDKAVAAREAEILRV